MPFCHVHKAARARRIRKAKRKPEWQDISPQATEQRSTWAVAARHVDKFARAYREVVRELARAIDKKKLDAALQAQDIERAVAAVPTYVMDDPESERVWAPMKRRFASAYTAVIEESGDAEAKRVTETLRQRLAKSEVVRKVEFEFTFDIDNPFSIPWVQQHTADLVTLINTTTKDVVRGLVEEGFRFGKPPAKIARQILNETDIGLTIPQSRAVGALERRLVEAGLEEEEIARRTQRYSGTLLRERARNIARTETIGAEGQGLEDSWRAAKEQGFLSTKAHKEWIAAVGSGRTCEICIGLDGQIVPVGESWQSSIVGTVDAPGRAHPSCRCGAAIVEPIDDREVSGFAETRQLTDERLDAMGRARDRNREIASERRKKRKRLTGVPR